MQRQWQWALAAGQGVMRATSHFGTWEGKGSIAGSIGGSIRQTALIAPHGHSLTVSAAKAWREEAITARRSRAVRIASVTW
jgi:hypothetical protein